MTIIAIILVCAASAYWLLKPKTKARRTAKRVKVAQRAGNLHHIYQAASINPGGCACAAVKALGDKRFLAYEAPQMPLPGCNSAKCQCRYVRHDDRRQREERRAVYCLQTDLHIVAGNEEHRVKTCRRRVDKLTEAASEISYNDIKWAT